jgi:hypothetical protein
VVPSFVSSLEQLFTELAHRHTRHVPLKTGVCAAVVALACLVGLAACGESNDQRAARKTVSRFYDALKRHDARTACGLLSPATADAMLRASHEGGKSCVAGLQDLFRRVAFDFPPKVNAATVHGNRAIVVISQGYQRRSVGLTRSGDGWQISERAAR